MSCLFCRECNENSDHTFSCPEGLICYINERIHDISEFINIESNRLMKYEKYLGGGGGGNFHMS